MQASGDRLRSRSVYMGRLLCWLSCYSSETDREDRSMCILAHVRGWQGFILSYLLMYVGLTFTSSRARPLTARDSVQVTPLDSLSCAHQGNGNLELPES